MRKIKQKVVSDNSTTLDLKSMIHQHSLFFDKLIELIPARFYLPTDDKEKPWFQGLSKEKKASAKKESRENIKKARRDRLDPGKASKTTLDLLKQNIETEKSNKEIHDDDEDEDETDVKPMMSGLDNDDRSVTYEELRQRLHRKIEELRGGRGSSDNKPKRDDRSKNRANQQNKRKRDAETEETKPSSSKSADEVEKDVEEASKQLTFSHFKLGDDIEEGGKKKRRAVSKVKELERAMQLEEAKNDPEKGDMIAKKHSWKAATSRAAGIKIHDDPKLLRQSIKKDKKKQEKNSQKWKERVETQEKMKTERQQKRSENISGRIREKKMRRIAKREKKLMRPGFEGRKEGFINDSQN